MSINVWLLSLGHLGGDVFPPRSSLIGCFAAHSASQTILRGMSTEKMLINVLKKTTRIKAPCAQKLSVILFFCATKLYRTLLENMNTFINDSTFKTPERTIHNYTNTVYLILL